MLFLGAMGVAPSSRADEVAPPVTLADLLVRPADGASRAGARLSLGPIPARMVLFPPVHITRPTDIPPPKPTRGLGLAFDW